MKIKAIDTEYNDYKFRSRTEARWAVFFDSLGWEYEYELEGFEFENGLKYLPDFLVKIPDSDGVVWDYYVEVKPQGDLSEYETRKIEALSKHTNVLVLKGIPDKKKTYLLCAHYEDSKVFWCPISFDDRKFGVYFGEMYSDYADTYSKSMLQAFKNARQARFEHGETPMT